MASGGDNDEVQNLFDSLSGGSSRDGRGSVNMGIADRSTSTGGMEAGAGGLHHRQVRHSTDGAYDREDEPLVAPPVTRAARVSKDEGLYLTDKEQRDLEAEEATHDTSSSDRALLISFILMVFIGLGNRILAKLQTIPMYNYALTLNLLTTFFYLPASWAYILPMSRAGRISREQLDMPKKPFAVMGFLDSIAGILQVFGATYLPGTLLILLLQSAIPVSMVISSYLLKAKYNMYQYIGAVVVAIGIVVVLIPTWQGGNGEQVIIWSFVLMISTIPMCLSSVYKEIALGEQELDPVFLNGWIAVYQFLFSIPLSIPAGYAAMPQVGVEKLPENIWRGLQCYAGISSKEYDDDPDDDTKVDDDCYLYAPLFVNCYLVFNVSYNILIILILQFGSANVLWMALTIMVPMGNIAFALPFMPDSQALQPTDIVGLVVIVSGLVTYRFGKDVFGRYFSKPEQDGILDLEDDSKSASRALLEGNDDGDDADAGDEKNGRSTSNGYSDL